MQLITYCNRLHLQSNFTRGKTTALKILQKSLGFCVILGSISLIILFIYLGVSSASHSVGKTVSSQKSAENLKKCKHFLCTIIELAASTTPQTTVENTKALIQKLIVSNIFDKISITRFDLIHQQ